MKFFPYVYNRANEKIRIHIRKGAIELPRLGGLPRRFMITGDEAQRLFNLYLK